MEERVPGSRTSPHRVEYHKAIAFGRGGKVSAGLSKIRVLLGEGDFSHAMPTATRLQGWRVMRREEEEAASVESSENLS